MFQEYVPDVVVSTPALDCAVTLPLTAWRHDVRFPFITTPQRPKPTITGTTTRDPPQSPYHVPRPPLSLPQALSTLQNPPTNTPQLLNLGTTDNASFTTHAAAYNTTAWALTTAFEDTYVSLIKALRALAYPVHPAALQPSSQAYLDDVDAPPIIPIFVMRPFMGAMDHATVGVVRRVREDGDVGTFWLDTSGWLEDPWTYPPRSPEARGAASSAPRAPDTNTDTPNDFWWDADTAEEGGGGGKGGGRWRLTPRGNQKAAMYLHGHLCGYLAEEGTRCPFMRREVYGGRAFDPLEEMLDRVVQRGREKWLRERFWGG